MGRKAPGIYRRGRWWWIHYYDQHGRRHFEKAGTYRQAVRARAARLTRAQVAGGRDYPALLALQNASAAVFASSLLLQGPPRTGRSPPASFSATRALAHHTPSSRSVVIV